MGDLCIKAGQKTYDMIKKGDFDFDRITTYVAPAGGPRWLAASGFDLALMESGVLGRSRPVLLTGSSGPPPIREPTRPSPCWTI